MKKKPNVKKASENMKIKNRIALSSALAIIIPIVITAIFASIFFSSAITSYFNFSSVGTNSYTMLNQIQWSQTLSSISNELISDDDAQEKAENINEIISPLEELGCMVYIEEDSKTFYSTADKETVLAKADSITTADTSRNTNYFGENGMVIINHAESEDSEYVVLIANEDYHVDNITQKSSAQNIASLLRGRLGIIILVVAALFVIAIVVLSLITSKTISTPLQKLSDGADEISRGNLDYVIDYESTNEIGKTVDSFNKMSRRLKASLEEQQEAEQSRKEMIAGVAHDLRTPLTCIKGYVEGLKDGIANTPKKQEKYLQTIYSSTNDMEKMLDHLMTVSKLELGQTQLETHPVNLNAFLSDCADETKAELEEIDFDFEYINSCADEEITVELDADRFARVIRNIISNSIKYRRKDIKGKVVFSVESYEKSVILSISDNGIGVDCENLGKIFDSFYRADKARSKSNEGSGIGLFVCKQIVELHGGHIWAMSKEGEGLTINISLNKAVTA